MIQYLFKIPETKGLIIAGILFAFALACIFLAKISDRLPRDLGREFAHDGKKSAGKPRGAGILFIIVFVIATAIFINCTREVIIYLVLVVAAMLTGFMDDSSKNPWGEYKKGFLDFLIALAVAVTFLSYNSNSITLPLFNLTFTVPVIVFGLLIVVLVWASINVTNCTDGVDGLSGTLTIITLSSILIFDKISNLDSNFSFLIILFITVILAYLWFNANPSKLMMGDAGSRAMGLFIAIAILKTNSPLLYIPFAIVMILDGGLGLVKVFLLRFFKIRILTKTRTPLHDQARKNKGWSNTQTVFRFAIIQIMVSAIVLYAVL